ncbi:MAG: hypothetical protein MJ082_05495 [Clostridia bacterium]|nr:hypothetical protein [Clostridia bacterium]
MSETKFTVGKETFTVKTDGGAEFACWNKSCAEPGNAYEAILTKEFEPKTFAWAYNLPNLVFSPKPDSNDNDNSTMTTAAGLLTLVIEENRNPGLSPIVPRIVANVREFISGGKEPMFDCCPFWNYPLITAALTLIKKTPTLCREFTEEEFARIDTVMEAFAYLCSFATDDRNDYCTGPAMRGNYNKGWNPNYRLANVPQILLCAEYFGGADKLNEKLASFNVDEMIARFEKYGFTRALQCWNTPSKTLADGRLAPAGKDLLAHGGDAFFGESLERNGQVAGKSAGTGVGVVGDYTYHGFKLNQPKEIFDDLLNFCFNGGPVINSYGEYEDGSPKAYILGGKSSPMLGKEGMMTEFKSGDGNGIRSSAAYTSHDLNMVVALLATFKILGIYDENTSPDVMKKVRVGIIDTIFKIECGYHSFSLGHGYDSHEETFGGYMVWKEYWKKHYGMTV